MEYLNIYNLRKDRVISLRIGGGGLIGVDLQRFSSEIVMS